MKEFADLCLKIIKLVICPIFIVVFSLGGAYLIHKYATDENHATEYRALCVKNEGKPVFNGKYCECMK